MNRRVILMTLLKGLSLFGFLALFALDLGCKGSDSIAPVTASFTPSGSASTANLVRLRGTTSGDRVTIDFTLQGPTSTNDLYSFGFDLVLSDPGVVELIPGSTRFGPALDLTGSQQGQILASQSGNRVTIGITKVGGGGGSGVGPTEEVLGSLDFHVVQRDFTEIFIEGTPPHDATALDSSGAIANNIVFDPLPSAINGS